MSLFSKIAQTNQNMLPKQWTTIKTIDMHTGGEPLRVIIAGFPELKGNSVLDYRRYIKNQYDYLRTALMFEPRGHADMYGCILVPPNDDKAHFGIIFMHNEGYSTMCGHAIIAISTLAAQMNWINCTEGENEIVIDAPCGRIYSYINIENKAVKNVHFHCVPSFVLALDQEINIPELGNIKFDLAYGGAFYAYVDLTKNDLKLKLETSDYRKIIEYGMLIKNEVAKLNSIEHPFEKDLSFLYGTIFSDTPLNKASHLRNVCVFAEGEVDRSPTGSGVSGRIAIEYARKNISLNQEIIIESITNATFTCKAIKETTYEKYHAVIPNVTGTAHITGMHTFIIDPNDPMKNGFIFR